MKIPTPGSYGEFCIFLTKQPIFDIANTKNGYNGNINNEQELSRIFKF